MIGGLYTAQGAMFMFETALNNSSNNLANVNTTGFKRTIVDFQDVHYTGPDQLQVGYGGRYSAITSRDQKQGPPIITDNQYDLFIAGRGFFPVTLANGTTAYTRDGTFRLDSTGTIVTADGFPLQPGLVVPPNAKSVSITPNGLVTAVVQNNNGVDQTIELGQIQLATFINPVGLRSLGRNLVQESDASGPAIIGAPGTDVLGTVRQGVVEGSNVEIVDELTELLTAQRAFAANSRGFRVSTDLLDSAFEIIR